MLKDGRRGVLRREAGAFLAGLGLAGRAVRGNPGRLLLRADDLAKWARARGGRPLDAWAVPRAEAE